MTEPTQWTKRKTMKEQLSLKSENGVLSKHRIKFPDIFDDIHMTDMGFIITMQIVYIHL